MIRVSQRPGAKRTATDSACPKPQTQPRRMNMKVLMVLTSHDQLGNTGRKTGFWLEELAAPYYVFK